ncbi:hypothetical protein EVAR_38222_1 [Eumeta japonica]|uniref:Uncharacterized protein n=1 Tax=Eumeta variegata TaxID=151549 RepID=A0A4C1XGJ6_EUMVA|nr:hypothetical protein EVAR_38222_1 [Eumeta japonica]
MHIVFITFAYFSIIDLDCDNDFNLHSSSNTVRDLSYCSDTHYLAPKLQLQAATSRCCRSCRHPAQTGFVNKMSSSMPMPVTPAKEIR